MRVFEKLPVADAEEAVAARLGERAVAAAAAISEAAGEIDEPSRRHQYAEAPAHRAEPIRRRVDRLNRRDGNADHHSSGRDRAVARSALALDVGFEAGDPEVAQLKVVADLAAADETHAAVGGDAAARQRGETFGHAGHDAEGDIGCRVRRGRERALLVGIADVKTGVEAVPQIRVRRRRLDVHVGSHCRRGENAERDTGKKRSFQSEPPGHRVNFRR